MHRGPGEHSWANESELSSVYCSCPKLGLNSEVTCTKHPECAERASKDRKLSSMLPDLFGMGHACMKCNGTRDRGMALEKSKYPGLQRDCVSILGTLKKAKRSFFLLTVGFTPQSSYEQSFQFNRDTYF